MWEENQNYILDVDVKDEPEESIFSEEETIDNKKKDKIAVNKHSVRDRNGRFTKINDNLKTNKNIKLKRKRKPNNSVIKRVGSLKSTILNTFLSENNQVLNCIEYKNVKIVRQSKNHRFDICHEDLNQFTKNIEGKNIFHCVDCDFNTEIVNIFKLHVIIHANINLIIQNIRKNENIRICHLCDKKFKDETQLSEHRINVHSDKSTKQPIRNKLKKPVPVDLDLACKKSPTQSIENIPFEPVFIERDSDCKKSPLQSFEPVAIDFKSDLSDGKESPPCFDQFHDNDSDDDDVPLMNYVGKVELKKEIKIEVTNVEKSSNEMLQGNITIEEIKRENDVVVKEEIVEETKPQIVNPKAKLKPTNCKNESKFKCNLCNKVVQSYRSFTYHRASHICHKCSFKSNDIKEVERHRKSNLECWYKCKYCDYKAPNFFSCRNHQAKKTCYVVEKPPEKSKDMLYCDICKYKTFFKDKLVNHIIEHQTGKEHLCKICSASCRSFSALYKHIKLHNCPKCSFKSDDVNEVERHVKTNIDCCYKCNDCNFITHSLSSWINHCKRKTCQVKKQLKMERSDEILYCKICTYKTHYKDILERHLKGHQSEKKFICKICNVAYPSSRSLSEHVTLHNCPHCSYVAVKLSDLLKHRKENPNCMFKCKYCDFTNIYKNKVTKHIANDCEKVTTDDKIKRNSIKILKFQCGLCEYKTNCTKYFEKHEAKHFNPKPFQCKLCDYKTHISRSLIAHEKTHSYDDKTYQCNLCDFECSTLRGFEAHKKIHGLNENEMKQETDGKEKDPRFIYCDKCEFRSRHLYYFKYHMKKHEDVVSHLCPHCGKAFHSVIDYHVHVKTHAYKDISNRKTFKCSYCDYSHHLKATVKIHERKHTGVKPYCCDICSYSSSYIGNLRTHKKKHFKNKANVAHNQAIEFESNNTLSSYNSAGPEFDLTL